MRKHTIASWLFGCLAAVLAAVVLTICVTRRDSKPLLLRSPQGAAECAQTVMDSVCAGDYAGVSRHLYGTPSLNGGSQGETAAARLIWDAFVSSLNCSAVGDCYADENGLARDYILSGLDIPSLIQGMKEAAPAVLEARLEGAENLEEIYDENGQYRVDFSQSVLEEAAGQAIAAGSSVERGVTLRLVYEDGAWWVMPDQALLAAISGGLV